MARHKKKKFNIQSLLLALFLTVVAVAGAAYFSGLDPETLEFETPQIISSIAQAPEHAPSETPVKIPSGHLIMMVLDVGKADSILITTPSKRSMLIDAGEKNSFPVISDAMERLGIEKLDVVVATHPHADHIGGMQKLIESYEVGQIYTPKVSSDTATYEGFIKAMNQKKLKPKEAKAGVAISFDPDVTVDILAPLNYDYDNMNDCSAVVKLTFGKTSFLLTGDIEKAAEDDMLLAYDSELRADMLKVAHHGSSTSSTNRFLSAVRPSIAVISVAPVSNSSSPHKDVIARLTKLESTILRTDRDGTVTLVSDGKKISVK